MKVLLTWYATDAEVARVRNAMPPGTTVFAPATRPNLCRLEIEYDDVAKEAPDADVMMGWMVPDGIYELAKNLKCFVWLHGGADDLDKEMFKRRGIKVANIRGANSVSTAEHTFALLLGIAKRLVIKHKALLESHWEPYGSNRPEYEAVILEGKTIGIVGYGMVGSAVGKRAKAFDMRVAGVRKHPERGGVAADSISGPAGMLDVLAESDFVVLSVPLTKETFGFIGEAAIKRMKKTAFLVNVGRGNLVQERHLHAALTENRIAGYASDVWWHYVHSFPPTYGLLQPSRTGLQKLPNVIGTMGQAGVAVPGIISKSIDFGSESAAAFIRGEPMPRTVDLDLGY
ncbi:MAG: phosphoglycerate dehydrogenase [Rhodospirillales bacterium]|nr:phosphoglycerate dehydrogenase [Rhodospirillales bacterium]